MNTKEYKFREFTDKDMFECKLGGTAVSFGYITSSERKAFFDFLLRVGFLKIVPPKTLQGFDSRGVYAVKETFSYTGMNEEKPCYFTLRPGECFELTRSFKIHPRTWGLGIDA